jgi:hypothetical protein
MYFIEVIKKGKLCHSNDRFCDKSHSNNLSVIYTKDNIDLCIPCVNKIINSEQDQIDPELLKSLKVSLSNLDLLSCSSTTSIFNLTRMEQNMYDSDEEF